MSLAKLHPRLQDHIKNNKWDDLREIQKKAFDPIYQGFSCTIEAPTSGGKTEAVLFPLLTRLASNKTSGFKVLYIAPLKALLNDLEERVVPYAEKCYMEAFKWHGDVSQEEKTQKINFPSDILLTTPESIEAILLRKANWVEAFSNLETIVIDEAHYFAFTERGPHLISLLERIESAINRKTQRIAVTATIGNPGDLLSWITGNRGGQSIRVENTSSKEKDFKILYFQDEGQELQNFLYTLLVNKKTIVFEKSRTRTEATATKINERNNEIPTRFPVNVKTHHSSVSKRLREDAEKSIKQKSDSSLNTIISTSTLELGIDIGELDQVIQIGGLNSSSSFLQRVGRTGRRQERPQYFRGLCTEDDDLILLTGCVSLGLNHLSENILFPKSAFHILAHQILCLCLQKRGTTANDIWQILSKASCFSNILREDYDSLIAYMLQENYLRCINGNVLLTSDKTEKKFLRANWKRLFSIFDTGPMYNVVDGKKIIGTLDSDFARAQEMPFVFVLGGLEWNATKIDHEMQQILVEKNETGIAPSWNTPPNYSVPFELAQEVGRILTTKTDFEFLDMEACHVLNRQYNLHNKLGWRREKWVLESTFEGTKIYLWTFSGDKINRALNLLISIKIGGNIKCDFKKVAIGVDKKAFPSLKDIYDLISDLQGMTQQDIQGLVEKEVKPVWFSKFSECLPKSLAQKTLCEKGMDIQGLVRELASVSIIY